MAWNSLANGMVGHSQPGTGETTPACGVRSVQTVFSDLEEYVKVVARRNLIEELGSEYLSETGNRLAPPPLTYFTDSKEDVNSPKMACQVLKQ
jgi:hypothetical protein